ncbi:MAG: 4-(cytidine 5'-diphospho)-2-C-methyl-D-erythritol kinase [Ignavibacteriae bacterium]|nr:MAG: 4-(cytidine 5'-diphospho)-2-C-methyl-D-erythritol kinase [Ignavibacteriota bacterium]
MKTLLLNAPAKINIGLNIVEKRLDGFHNLETFFHPIYDLHDKLSFEKSENFIFDSNNNLVKDEDNLIVKAHTLIEKLVRRKLTVKINLEKNIPMGAGLGGGSSDAAAAIIGLNKIFDLKIPLKKLYELALELGSDVPFFITSKPAIGFSRGEVLTESDFYINLPILIINPGIHISTREAFSFIKPKKSNFDYNLFTRDKSIIIEELKDSLKNDFEEYVFEKYPEIKNIKDKLYNCGALFSLMSGTGSTVYGIFSDVTLAKAAYNKFPKKYFKFISTE